MESPIPELEPSQALQVSAPGPDGEPVLCVLAKRVYSFRGGVCRATDDPALLVEEPVFDGTDLILEADTDHFPRKPFTDVTVRGHAYGLEARDGRAVAGVVIAGQSALVDVVGDREASLGAGGAVRFSEPAPFEQIPLTWERAYGGRDRRAEELTGFTGGGLFGDIIPPGEASPDLATPFAYPRNPAGTGYILTADAASLEGLVLPNFEVPGDALTPGRLAVGSPELWPGQPRAAGFGPVNYDWFPRDAFFGFTAGHERDARFAEVEDGLVEAPMIDMGVQSAAKAERFTCCAPLALQFPHLGGGEPVELRGFSPEAPSVTFRLPRAPKMKADGRKGKMKDAPAVLHTVAIEPDEFRVTVVWRGMAGALRMYGPQELPNMPFEVQWQD